MSVKNGAELLDRLIKDIVSESATSYVSIVHDYEKQQEDDATMVDDGSSTQAPTAFSLPRFIPLLQERILVLNPFTRMFLVSWITLLDSIPDLELVSYLPSFLGGMFRFLNDSNQDVVTATQHVLERFLDEIKLVAKVKRGIAENRKSQKVEQTKGDGNKISRQKLMDEPDSEEANIEKHDDDDNDGNDNRANESGSDNGSDDDDDDESNSEDDWIPGQDVHVDHPKILDILVTFLKDASGKLAPRR